MDYKIDELIEKKFDALESNQRKTGGGELVKMSECSKGEEPDYKSGLFGLLTLFSLMFITLIFNPRFLKPMMIFIFMAFTTICIYVGILIFSRGICKND